MRFSWLQSVAWFREVTHAEDERAEVLDVSTLHARHGDFVFACLQRLGIRGPGLEDAHQEVFLVVHRKLDSYVPSVNPNAWLFGICRRVAAAQRRKAYRKREVLADPDWEIEDIDANPEAAFERGEKRRRVERLLDKLDDEKRVVLVMFEIEGIEGDRIAAELGIPIGTVYSRLHGARRDFEKVMARDAAREARMKRRER